MKVEYDDRPTINKWRDKVKVTVSAAINAPNVQIGLIMPRTIFDSITPEVYTEAILEIAAEKYVEHYWEELQKLEVVQKLAKTKAKTKKAA
jgi:hypothetical protein